MSSGTQGVHPLGEALAAHDPSSRDTQQAMLQENAEVVASVYEAFARRDNASPFDVYAADIEWDVSRGFAGVGGSVYHGHEGVREFLRDLLAAFSVVEFTVEEITGAGDRVLATVREHYLGRASGVEVDRHHYSAWTLRGGKVTQMCVYLDRAEAVDAVGLPKHPPAAALSDPREEA